MRPRRLGQRRDSRRRRLPQRLRAAVPAQRRAALPCGSAGVVADVAKAVVARRRLGRVAGLVDDERAVRVDVDGDVEERALAVPRALVALERHAIESSAPRRRAGSGRRAAVGAAGSGRSRQLSSSTRDVPAFVGAQQPAPVADEVEHACTAAPAGQGASVEVLAPGGWHAPSDERDDETSGVLVTSRRDGARTCRRRSWRSPGPTARRAACEGRASTADRTPMRCAAVSRCGRLASCVKPRRNSVAGAVGELGGGHLGAQLRAIAREAACARAIRRTWREYTRA